MTKTIKIYDSQMAWRHLQQSHACALEYLYKMNYKRFYDYGMRICYDSNLTEDAIQDLFLKIWEKRHTLTQPDNVKNYLTRTFRNLLIDKIRLANKHNITNAEHQLECFPTILSKEEVIIFKEKEKHQTQKVQRLLNELPARQKEILYLIYFKSMPYEQVAEVLEIKKRTVYNLAFRALTSLRATCSNG